MAFEGFFACFCCKKDSKSFIRASSILNLALSSIKIVSFLVFFLVQMFYFNVRIFFYLNLVLEVLVFVSSIILLRNRQNPDFSLVFGSGIYLVLIFFYELLIFFYILIMFTNSGHLNHLFEFFDADYDDGKNTVSEHVLLLVYFALVFLFAMWQLYTAVNLVLCARYNMDRHARISYSAPNGQVATQLVSNRSKQFENNTSHEYSHTSEASNAHGKTGQVSKNVMKTSEHIVKH